jgi:hypothetical protein
MNPDTQLEKCLLAIDKVAGVSVKDDSVLIFLEDDSDAVRSQVFTALASLDFKGAVTFEVTGPFELL